jgi:hypothetical protein
VSKAGFLGNSWLLIATVVVCIGGYILYRYRDVQDFEARYNSELPSDPTNIQYADVLQGVSATICNTSETSFVIPASAVMYVYKGWMREDVTAVRNGEPILIHNIGDPEGDVFVWQDQATQGIEEPPSYNVGQTAINDANANIIRWSYSCVPWWLPDSSLFTVPTDVRFEQTNVS